MIVQVERVVARRSIPAPAVHLPAALVDKVNRFDCNKNTKSLKCCSKPACSVGTLEYCMLQEPLVLNAPRTSSAECSKNHQCGMLQEPLLSK